MLILFIVSHGNLNCITINFCHCILFEALYLVSMVTEAPAGFLTPLKDQSVTEFDTTVFDCEISKANLKVKWLKNDVVLEPSKHFEMTCMGNKYMLTIRETQMDDQAQYTIVPEPGVESKAKLTVKGKLCA
jgi:hypothetical protein